MSKILRHVLIYAVALTLLPQSEAGTLYVRKIDSPVSSTPWDNGFERLSDAIQASAVGDEIWIASGTYHETISIGHGVSLYGGFIGNEEPDDFELRDSKANPVIIDGTGSDQSVITLTNANETLFDGITIRNGRSLSGGGIHCTTSGLTLVDCQVLNNEAFGIEDCESDRGPWNYTPVNCHDGCIIQGGLGGGFYLEKSTLILRSCEVTSNRGTVGGGIFASDMSSVVISDSTVSSNTALSECRSYYGTCCDYESCWNSFYTACGGGYGGGIFVSASSLQIEESRMDHNFASFYGGGVAVNVNDESIRIEDTSFNDNLLEGAPNLLIRGGGAVYCRSQSSSFIRCLFKGNECPGNGGGLSITRDRRDSISHEVLDCTFENNIGSSRYSRGGGLHLDVAKIEPTVLRCQFIGNSAGLGGGVHSEDPALFKQCEWRENHAIEGGAISGSGNFLRCRMIHNSATTTGGAISGDEVSVSNCLIAFNEAKRGGAIYAGGVFHPVRLGSSTVYGNHAEDTGGIIAKRAIYSDLFLSVVNSILWNTGAEIDSDSWSASYSDIQGGATGEGNINAYPLFQDIASDNYRLLNGSPCINRGSDQAVLASVDLQGASRIQGEGVDIGAFEAPGHYEAGDLGSIPRIHVKPGGDDNGPGDSWESAFGSINAAMAWATDGTEIWVQGGDYSEPILLEEGVSLYGGFSGMETSLSERVPESTPTQLLGGDFFGSIVVGAGIQSASLDGFTVTGGRADSGGGFNLSGSGAYTLANCRILDNTCESNGGGVFCGNGTDISFSNCSIGGNSAGGGGGGVFLDQDCKVHVEDCLIDSNAASNGGGIYARSVSGQILNSTVEANQAGNDGGGGFFSGDVVMENCLFKENSATNYGGIHLWGEGDLSLFVCCILSNEAATNGGGVGLTGNASPTFIETDVSDNRARIGGGLYVGDRSLPVFDRCEIIRNHAVHQGSTSPPLGSGGGLYAGGAQLILKQTVISENTGDYQGGGLFGSHSAYLVHGCTMTHNQGPFGGGVYLSGVPVSPFPSSSFKNCLFVKNRADRLWDTPDGGAACLANNAPAIFENCTLVDNRARSVGGIGGGVLSVTNCILWNQGIEIDSSKVTVRNSSCQGGCYGVENQYGFPQFRDLENGDYRLANGSPCIDRGVPPSDSNNSGFDLDGLPRIENGGVDIGCYEAPEGSTSGTINVIRSPLHVRQGGFGKQRGGSWEEAFPDINSALLVSTTGTEIWIAEGEYRESITAEKGITIYGGFSGVEDRLSERAYGSHSTIVNATGLNRSVMYIPKAVQCVVDGLTLTGGDPGGGIHCDDLSDSVLRNLIVTRNRSGISGGIHISPNSKALIENCLLSRNSATRGGAMSIQYAEVEMIHCTLAANTGSQGSGVIVTGAGAVPQLRVWNSIFWNEGPEEIIAYPENRVIQIEDSQVRGSWNGTGNSGLDPGFIDYSGGDFRLSESSPCLDTGKPNRSLQSLNGVPRPVDLPGIGADGADRGPDRGAFERPLEGHPTWTPTPTATITPTPTPDFDLVRDEVVNALDLLELLKQAKEAENGEVPLFEFNEYWLRSTTR